jgi:hypothetical protein
VRLTRFDARDHVNHPKDAPLAPVSILQSFAAGEFGYMRHMGDFRSPTMFEFFNTISRNDWPSDARAHLIPPLTLADFDFL